MTTTKKKLPKAGAELPPWGEHGAIELLHRSPKTIRPSPLNPWALDEAVVYEIACSIRRDGFWGSVLGRYAEGGELELIWGHHRRAAAELAGLDEMPIEVIEANDRTVRRLQIAENWHRRKRHHYEEAVDFDALVKAGETVEEIAAGLALRVELVRRRLVLVDLIEDAAREYRADRFGTAVAEKLAALQPLDQERLLTWVLEQEPSANDVAEEIRQSVLLQLDLAPWDRKDPTLHGGACAACPKRTSAATFLFDDAADGDSCLDRECFGQKRAEHLDRACVKVEREAGESPKLVSTDANAPAGMLPADKWRRASGKDPCAVPAVVAAGQKRDGLGFGDPLHICGKGKACPIHGTKAPAPAGKPAPAPFESEEKARKEQAKKDRERRAELVAQVASDVPQERGLDVAQTRYVLDAFWHATHANHKARIADRRGWSEIPERLAPLDVEVLLLELALEQDPNLERVAAVVAAGKPKAVVIQPKPTKKPAAKAKKKR